MKELEILTVLCSKMRDFRMRDSLFNKLEMLFNLKARKNDLEVKGRKKTKLRNTHYTIHSHFDLDQTCPNLFKLVQTFPNLLKLAQTCLNLPKIAQIYLFLCFSLF